MKTKLTTLKFLIILCSVFATTAAFGQGTGNALQTNFTWIAAGANLDLATSANWTPQGVPVPARNNASSDYGDIMTFDGRTAGPVSATSNSGAQTGSSVGGTTAGLYVHLTANQTNPVTFHTTLANSASSGIRFNSITIDAGAGSFYFGKGTTTNALDTIWGTSNPQSHGLTNNSANPAYILPDMRWRLGAGGAHTFVFGGTGDWHITNDLANIAGAATLIAKDGPGTMYWTTGRNSFWGTETVIASPMTISGGTLMLLSSGLFPPNTTINMSSNAAASVLEFNVVGGSQTIANSINGNGSVQVNNGTLTLGSANTYTGNTILSGGELIVNRAENPGVNGPLGNGGFISFTGGTLGFSMNNTYDYSPRFTNAPGQAISIDTAGVDVTFTNALTSSGGSLTKLGAGTLTLSGANTYGGNTVVGAGKLVIQGSLGTGGIIISNNAALGVTGGGAQITPSSLTIGTTSSATMEFNNVTGTTTPIITAGIISAAGAVTVNVNGGSFVYGGSYPLLKWTNGAAPTFALGSLTGAAGNLSVSGNTLYLNITSLSFVWNGNVNGNWDTITPNWRGPSSNYINGSYALLDDSASGQTNVTVTTSLFPAGVTVNNTAKTYSITSSGLNNIGGFGGLTKNGSSTLTLAGGANSYTGATVINGGTVSISALAKGNSVSDIGASGNSAANLFLNSGTLQYAGAGDTCDRQFTLGTAGGTIDSSGTGALNLTNAGAVAMSSFGARTLVLAGSNAGDNWLAASLSDSGGATALSKTGAGKWIVTGSNPISGAVNISAGTLQAGNGGATGSVGGGSISNNGALIFKRTGSVTCGTIGGTGSLTADGGGTVILPGNNTYSGGTTIANGSTLQVGNGGATGQLIASGTITNDGTLDFNTAGTFVFGGNGITGSGNVIVRGGGKITSYGANSYAGWTLIRPGSTFQPCQGNQGALASSVVTNNGTLLLIRQDNGVFIYSGPVTGSGRIVVDANAFNAGDVTLTGNCDYSGGTIISDNTLIVGDGSTNGWITGNVSFANSTQVPNDNARTLTFNRSDNVVFAGNIVTNFSSPQSNRGVVVQSGAGTLTLLGDNTYGSGTTINAGTIQVGNGGTTGSIGTGPVTDNGALVLNRADSVTLSNAITGTGSFVKSGPASLTLTAPNSYFGDTFVNGGKLLFQSTKSGTGNITITNGTALGVTETAMQITPGVLTLGTGAGCTLEFNNVTNTTTAPIAAGTISLSGTNTIIINSGAFSVNQSYPLFSWSSGSAPVVRLGSVSGAVGNLSISNQTVFLNITATALTWSGSNNGSWDTTTTNNWMQNGSPVVFANGFPIRFDDTAPGTRTVSINALVQPTAITVSNNASSYSIASSIVNNIAGSTGLTKEGGGTLVLSGGLNTYTGVTSINGGILSVGVLASGGSASDIGAANNSAANLVLNGGTLQFTGQGASVARSFTLGTNGGTIDAPGSGLIVTGSINITNSGSRTLTLTGTGTGNTLAGALSDSSIGGVTSLTKSGAGTWVLTGANTHSGGTLIANGTLQVGAGGATGALGTGNITNNGALVFNRTDHALHVPGVVSGIGSVTKLGSGDVTLDGENTYTGGTAINAGYLLVGKLYADGPVTNNGTLAFAGSGSFTLNGIISGAGSVQQDGFGTVTLNGNNTYTGDTVINDGPLFINGSNAAAQTLVEDIFPSSMLGGTGTLSGPVTLQAARTTLAPGASIGSVGTLTINNDLFIGGNVAIDVNKSLSQSNDLVVVSGLLVNTGTGTLTVSNLGQTLAVGDRFTLFSKPMQNGAAVTVSGARANWINNLAVDGSITVGSLILPPTLNFTRTGYSLQFTWTDSFNSFKLQSQTNSLVTGLGTNWTDYPGGGTSPVTVPIAMTNRAVFFKLLSTP